MCAVLVATVCVCTDLAGACMLSISLEVNFTQAFHTVIILTHFTPPPLSACKCQLFWPLRLIFTLIIRAERLPKKNGKCRKIPAPAGPRLRGCFHPTRCVFVVVFVSVDLQLHMEVGVSIAATLTTLCSPLFKWQLLSITLNGKPSMA